VIELGLLAAVAFVVFAVVMVLVAVFKTLLWLVLLPLRLVLSVLLLPLLFLKALIGGLLVIVLSPILVIGLAIAAITTIVAIAVPLLPVLLVAFVVSLVPQRRRSRAERRARSGSFGVLASADEPLILRTVARPLLRRGLRVCAFRPRDAGCAGTLVGCYCQRARDYVAAAFPDPAHER
jgi:hypothetical protein